MKEQPKGPFGRATAVAEGVAAAVRRRQREREPRVLLYRKRGRPVRARPRGQAPRRRARRGGAHGGSAGRRMTLVDPGLAARVIERALRRGGDLAELYAEDRRSFSVSLDDGRVERPGGGTERGASVRVVSGGGKLVRARGRAGRGVAAGDGRRRCGGRPRRAARGRVARRGPSAGANPVAVRPETVAAERKADLLRALNERARSAGAEVAEVSVGYCRGAAGRRDLQLRRRRGGRRPHAHAALGPGGGPPGRPRGDRLGNARRARGL